MSDGERHRIERVRRETRRRLVTVASTERLSPSMLRIWLHGDELTDFDSAAPDDHVKIFVPVADGVAKRDYTPRIFDRTERLLAIDFALHEAGPATSWAMSAKPGDTIEIGGPRGSTIVPDDFDWYLLIGDDTAIPAISRRVEELRSGVPVFVLVSAANEATRPHLPARPGMDVRWSYRSTNSSMTVGLLASLDGLKVPGGDGFVWIGAEAEAARTLRDHLTEALGHPRQWIKASGYWSAGQAGAHTKLVDDISVELSPSID